MIQILLLCVTEADNLRLLVSVAQTILQVSAVSVHSVQSVLDKVLVSVCHSLTPNVHLCALLPPATDRREEAEQTVIENLRGGHQREAHAEPQQAARVGNVGRLGDLLILHEPLCIGILKYKAFW